jgi:hypothetical protein
MPDTLANIDERIAAVRENLGELTESASASLGAAADEDFNADRIAEQEGQLASLFKQRDALSGRATFELAGIAAPAYQEPARLMVAPPLPEALALGLAVIQYSTDNLRILPVYGPAALSVTPRIGHLHVTLDDAAWHWVDASGEPVIIQGLSPGPHRVLLELADPTHKVVDRTTVSFEIPRRERLNHE